MPPRYIILHKDIGQTPLQALEAWRDKHPAYASLPASYAGRLDPMASGLLLVLLGEECKKQAAYTKLDKEYEIEVLLDVKSDSGDILGRAYLVPDAQTQASSVRASIAPVLKKLSGPHTLPYPVFSSKTVNGKPLFLYALEGTLDTITIPQHVETIYRIELIGMETLEAGLLRERVESLLARAPTSEEASKMLGADFRIEAVRASWENVWKEAESRRFSIVRLRVSCASGTYMRTLAGRLGEGLDTCGLALSIRRTKIGRYVPFGSFGFWRKRYR